jgi:uncharacterized protein DUF4390
MNQRLLRGLYPFLLAALLAGPAVLADGPLDGDFEVVSAYAVTNQGVVQLSARIRYPVTERVRMALRDGVTLDFDLDVNIERKRRLWFDVKVTEESLRRELSYHVVTDRYIVWNADGTELESFATLAAAIERIGQVDSWPVATESQLPGDGPWQISARAGVRRGRLPDALQTLMFWSDAWHRSSNWYSWTLVH